MAEPQYVSVEQLKAIVDSFSQELASIKVDQFRTVARLETALRHLATRPPGTSSTVDFGEFLESTEDYRKWREGLVSCMQEQNVLARVDKALELNKVNKFPLYADDLEIVSQVSAAGGTSPEAAKKFLNLPHSPVFKRFATQYIPEGK